MTRGGALGLIGAVVAGALALLWSPGGRDVPQAVADATPTSTSSLARSVTELEPSVEVPKAVAEPERTAVDAEPSDLVRVRGRCFGPDGVPLAGVTFEALAGEPVPVATTESVADGRFGLVLAAPEDGRATLRARHATRGQWGRQLADLVPGALVDLGDVWLAPLATIAGRVVDAEGEPRLGEDWQVSVNTRGASPVRARVDPGTAHFRLEHLPSGHTHVQATRAGGHTTGFQTFLLTGGEEREVDLVYAGPPDQDRITIKVFGVRMPRSEHLRLLPEDGGEPLFGEESSFGRTGTFTFEALAPGTYTLVVDDPGLAPFERRDLSPGDTESYHAAGRSSLEIAVRETDGRYLEVYSANARHFDAASGSTSFTAAHAMPEPFAPGARVLSDLSDGPVELVIERPGAAQHVVVLELPAGGTLRHVVELEPTATVVGRVVDELGDGVPDATVRLLRRAEVDDGPWSRASSPVSYETYDELVRDTQRGTLATSSTDANGAFALRDVRPGAYLVRPESRAGAGDEVEVVVAMGEVDAGEVRLPRPATVVVTLAGVGEVLAPSDVRLFAVRAEPGDVKPGTEWHRGPHAIADFQANGTAELLVTEGTWDLSVTSKRPHVRLLSLGEVRLAPAERRELVAEFTDGLPGELRVRRGPEARGPLKVRLVGPLRTTLPLTARSDDHVALLPPGVYEVGCSDPSGRLWSAHFPGTYLLRPGETTHVTLEVATYAGELRFVPADPGTASELGAVEWGYPHIDGTVVWHVVDRPIAGPRRLFLPPDTYFVRLPAEGGRPAGPSVEVHWTTDGPTEREVRVPAR